MCIIFIHGNENAKPGEYRLIIAHNRDEYFNRPTQEAVHCENTNVIGGRDLKSDRKGGMFLGVACKNNPNQGPRLCVSSLLNITGHGKQKNSRGRGFFVSEYLTNENTMSGKEFVQAVHDDTENTYNAYNFVVLEMDEFGKIDGHLQCNLPKKLEELKKVDYLAFGNTPHDTPLTKVTRGKAQFEDIVSKNLPKTELIEELYKLLKNPKPQLPDPEMQSRVPDLAQHLCSIFVKVGNVYGTRTHTIILVDYDFNIEYIESTLDTKTLADIPKWKEQTIKFQL